MAGLVDRKRWGGVAVAAVLLVGLGALLLGCGGDSEGMPTTTIAAASETTMYYPDEASGESDKASGAPVVPGEGSAGDASLDRKVISNASLLIEVEQGKFQMMFDRARLLADKYGGYVISSNSSASGDEDVVRSGTIALRVPEASFQQVLTDAGALGTVKSQQIDTQDVTEEYVDLEARLKNAEAQERAYLSLMDKAKTVDEILTVRQVLSQTQQEIEQLKGRIRFLDEHTSFSTITMSIYEKGVDTSNGGWGFVDAVKKAVHAFVDSVADILVFFGGALPVLALLALIVWLAYKLGRPVVRRFSRGSRQHPPGAGAYGYNPAAPPYDPSLQGGHQAAPPTGGVPPAAPGFETAPTFQAPPTADTGVAAETGTEEPPAHA